MEAAFFDLDKTVIAKAAMVAFGPPLRRAGLLSRWLLLRALYGHLVFLYLGADEERMAKMRDKALAITKGWQQAHVRAIVQETIDEVIEPIVYVEALDLIREHQDAGRRVYLISASPEEVVGPLARWLGVDEAIATRAEVDAEGRYTGRVARYAQGPAKADRMRELAATQGIDLPASYAYSDSATDLPMLEAVGHPVAVNPDRELARIARDRSWEIRWFARQVSLRDRLHLPPPGSTAVVGGGLAAAVSAGLVAWWWLRREPEPARLAPVASSPRRLPALPAAARWATAARRWVRRRGPS